MKQYHKNLICFCVILICVLLIHEKRSFNNTVSKPQVNSSGLWSGRHPSCRSAWSHRVAIVVYADQGAIQTLYNRSLATVACYARRMQYQLIVLIDHVFSPKSNCTHIKQVMYRRHCVVSWYMAAHEHDVHWVLVIDADMGVVNPNHCIEDYIVEDVDMIFYERFFNWEIAAGGFIMRNNAFSRNFLNDWARWWNISKRKKQKNCCSPAYEHVYCVNELLSARRHSDHVYVYHRAHAWVLDRHVTPDLWTEQSFMQHGWKSNQVKDANWVMKRIPVNSTCEPGSRQRWPAKTANYRNLSGFQLALFFSEKHFLFESRKFNKTEDFGMIRHCWPHCTASQNRRNKRNYKLIYVICIIVICVFIFITSLKLCRPGVLRLRRQLDPML